MLDGIQCLPLSVAACQFTLMIVMIIFSFLLKTGRATASPSGVFNTGYLCAPLCTVTQTQMCLPHHPYLSHTHCVLNAVSTAATWPFRHLLSAGQTDVACKCDILFILVNPQSINLSCICGHQSELLRAGVDRLLSFDAFHFSLKMVGGKQTKEL